MKHTLAAFILSLSILSTWSVTQPAWAAPLEGSGSGLSGWYTFDENSGSTAYDSSGNARNGTLVNAPSRLAGKLGQALHFSGGNNGTSVTMPVPFAYPMAACAWIRPTLVSSGVTSGIVFWASPLGLTTFDVDGSYNLTLYDGASTVSTPSGSITPGSWQHVCMTGDSAGASALYINGALSASGTLNTTTTQSVMIGDRGNYETFNGDIDDARFYNRALTPSDVTSLYNEGLNGGPSTTYALTITNNGNGTVTSQPSGISCPGTCSAPFIVGSPVQLTGAPIPGYLTTWTGCNPTSSNSCVALINADTAVSATFVPIPPAPVISSLTKSSITSSSVAISWQTDVPADTQVDYGTSNSYGQSSALTDTNPLATSHSVTLSGLAHNTTYHFRVDSKEHYGVLGQSADDTFTTLPPGPAAPDYVSAKGVAPDQINLVWYLPQDGDGTVSTYTIYRDSASIATIPAPTYDPSYRDTGVAYYEDKGLTPNTQHSYYVIANDSASFHSPASASVTATTQTGSTGLIPANRLTDWTPGVTVGVPGGIDSKDNARSHIVDVTQPPFNAPVNIAATGIIATGSAALSVNAIQGFSAGGYVVVPNAGTPDISYHYANDGTTCPAGTISKLTLHPLLTTIQSIVGTTLNLADSASYTASYDVYAMSNGQCVSTHYDGTINNAPVYPDSAGSINDAIAAAADNDVIFLPVGRYAIAQPIYIGRSNVTLRGSGANSTILDGYAGITIRGDDDIWWDGSPSFAITAGVSKGSSQITLADASVFSVGNMAQLTTANDVTQPVISPGGVAGPLRKQNVMITGKSGNTLTIAPPLMAEFDPTASQLSSPIGPHPFWLTSFVGVEDLSFDASNGYVQNGFDITGTYGSWIKNVNVSAVRNRALLIADSLYLEIRHGRFTTNHTGTNGGALIMGGTTGALIEDNMLGDPVSIQSLEVDGSVMGSVFAYNLLYSGDTNHGAHNSYNLYEGNVAIGFESDGYYGSESETTFFRNNLAGFIALKRFSRNFSVVENLMGNFSLGQPNIGNGGSIGIAEPNEGIFWKDWNPSVGPATLGTFTNTSTGGNSGGTFHFNSHDDALRFYGYIVLLSNGLDTNTNPTLLGCDAPKSIDWGQGKDWNKIKAATYAHALDLSTDTMTIVDPYPGLSPSLPPTGTTVGVWPRSEGFQELDMDVALTIIRKNNYVSGEGGIPSYEATGQPIQPSLYLGGSPSWFGNLAWPPFDPSNPNPSSDAIPAEYRYHHNDSDPPGVSGPTSYAFAVIKRGTGSGTVTGSDGKVNCGSNCSESSVQAGSTVALTATPAAGSTFGGWSGGGCTGTGVCTVTTGSVITAAFNPARGVKRPMPPRSARLQ